MQFPVYQVPYLTNGMTIGLNAIVHVLISHGVAIGLVAMIVISEYLGYRRRSQQWETAARNMIKPVVIIITGVGAITGAGIWFITSALAPRGIGSMLRIFFWPWFIEWVVFALEVVVIIFYYFTWDHWQGEQKRKHIRLGIWYVALASISAFLITGILGFMLTSDGWPWNNNFFAAFFNPSFIPQLFIRLSFSIVLGAFVAAGYYSLSGFDRKFRSNAIRIFGLIALVALITWGLSSWWYFEVVPSTFKTHAVYFFLTKFLSQQPELLWLVALPAGLIVLLFAAISTTGNLQMTKILFIPALILAIGFVVQFERVREFIRGPFLMPGYMYANQMLLKERPLLNEEGVLQNSFWYNKTSQKPSVNSKGSYLFFRNCSCCHTIGGMNDIRERVKGRTEDGIFVIVGNTNRMIPFMPPFTGTQNERRLLSAFLYRISNEKVKNDPPARYHLIQSGKGGAHE